MSSAVVDSGRVRYFRRFSASQRLQHGVQILTFTTLCFTGLVQKFSNSDTLETLIVLLGGIERLRSVHRIAAAIFVFEAVYHALELGWLILVKRARLSMLPTLKDGRDASQMFKYFLGLTTERPQYDRFDFKQKVEYLSLIWGSIVMISTGLLMWFPTQAAVILPGEVIPAARVAHGGEGLLACLVIFTWHMYSAHFSPEVFPIDTTIFTGLISESRMIHEHPLEYARIMADEAANAEVSFFPAPAQALNRIPVRVAEAPVLNSTGAVAVAQPAPLHAQHASALAPEWVDEEIEAIEIDYLDDGFDEPTGTFKRVTKLG
jgi:formate dehydrogenase subunit gamma